MHSMFGDWPSHDPHNFSQLRPSDPANPLLSKGELSKSRNSTSTIDPTAASYDTTTISKRCLLVMKRWVRIGVCWGVFLGCFLWIDNTPY
ncbi:hypothetical protein SOVF_174490 [Spinacia oleracea]|nr:hypothetical protein SOVF_174490 [Spinacia oleracea]